MTKQIILATRNPHKAEELARILKDQELNLEIVTIDKFPDSPEVAETESSFVGNALLKARAIVKHTGIAAIADDSGICINALNGMPGVFSARWSGATENVDQENLKLVLKQIADVPDVRRGAQFVCAAVAVFPDGTELISRGVIEGEIVREPKGSNGFGYDPIFQATGSEKTTAELNPTEKDLISHRGQALKDLVQQLIAVVS